MKNFTLPIGQEKIISYFEKIKKDDTFSALYVIEGERLSGKKTLVKYLSLLIMCNDAKPCLECPMCRYTLSGTNMDIITVSNEEKASIGIDKVREIIKEAYIKPKLSDKKIFIIENAHLLTKEAQNALLKVIEEPHSYVLFFLLSENSSYLLQTVLSRAVKLRISLLSKDDLQKTTGCNDDFLIEYASGCAGKLIELMNDEKYKEMRQGFYDVIENFLSGKMSDMYKIYDFFVERKEEKEAKIKQEERQKLLELIITFFRDVLLNKTSCDKYIKNKDKTYLINKFSNALTERKCANICNILVKSQNELGKNGAYAVNIHLMLIKIWEEIYG